MDHKKSEGSEEIFSGLKVSKVIRSEKGVPQFIFDVVQQAIRKGKNYEETEKEVEKKNEGFEFRPQEYVEVLKMVQDQRTSGTSGMSEIFDITDYDDRDIHSNQLNDQDYPEQELGNDELNFNADLDLAIGGQKEVKRQASNFDNDYEFGTNDDTEEFLSAG